MPVDPIPVDGIRIETRGAFRSVHHKVPNLSFGSGGSVSSLQRLTCHTSARFHVRAPGPVSGQLYETASGGLALIASLSCRLSATGVRFLGILFRARELGFPYGRLTGPPEGRPDPDGVSGYRTYEARLGPGAFSTPGTAVSTQPSPILGRPLPHFNGMSLSPWHYHPTQGVPMTRHQQRFTVIHPMPVFSMPVIPGRRGNP